jgi:hypothetical protein
MEGHLAFYLEREILPLGEGEAAADVAAVAESESQVAEEAAAVAEHGEGENV